ncbi:MAG: class I tRNA ligase family protein, partial [Anaerolineaceae bacterium]|nr:class I tRNA ligase family protein [Anaerolineaceae bacterium]
PFDTVYLHGLIRDKYGHKMSKSLDNVIDPLEVMDEMGTDAMRFTLLVGSTPGKDMNLDVQKVEANRNFANKIWNAGRYISGAIQKTPPKPDAGPDWTPADSWIWARLMQTTRSVNRLFETHQYGEAGRQIYEFFWSEFADWYIEVSKLQLAEGGDRAYYTTSTLVRVMDAVLRMLHPFTPFITEELWGYLKRAAEQHSEHLAPQGGWEDALIIARWPEFEAEESWEAGKVADFKLVQDMVRAIRNLRSEKKVTPGKRIPATIVVDDVRKDILVAQASTITALAHLDAEKLVITQALTEKPEGQISLVTSGCVIYLPLADLVDVDAERLRMKADLDPIQSQINRLEKLLGSEFADKAPEAVVEKERAKLITYRESAQKLREQLKNLQD